MHSRMSGKYWRDSPKAKASMLIVNELGFSNVSGDSVKVSEITDEKKGSVAKNLAILQNQ